jgi:hypothetical protein
MKDSNPLVKDTVQGTLNEIINTLDYISESLPPTTDEAGEGIEPIQLSPAQISGLRNIMFGVKAATESCFGQYMSEKGSNSGS